MNVLNKKIVVAKAVPMGKIKQFGYLYAVTLGAFLVAVSTIVF